MKIKMISALATSNMVFSYGGVYEVDKKFAETLIANKMAVLVKQDEPKKQKPMETKKPKVKQTRKKLGE